MKNLLFSGDHEPVSQGKKHIFHPGIVLNFLAVIKERFGLFVHFHRRIEDFTTPEHIICYNKTTLFYLGEHQVILGTIVLLVGIDKHEVKRLI